MVDGKLQAASKCHENCCSELFMQPEGAEVMQGMGARVALFKLS